MTRCKFKKIFAWLLLFYFAGFAVSPVSAIFPSTKQESTQEGLFNKPDTKNELFFFDLALWELLKSAKRSDNSKAILLSQDTDASAKDASPDLCNYIASFFSTPVLSCNSKIRFCELHLKSYTSTYRFLSGLSPPFSS